MDPWTLFLCGVAVAGCVFAIGAAVIALVCVWGWIMSPQGGRR